ncbi:MAG: gliding motility-associated protein GldE [Flavobacteriaceae bacterium]|nr:gliding motility-associated protein GldE [Flavobacteriaceae bacterium]
MDPEPLYTCCFFLFIDVSVIIQLVLLVLLLAMSAFISGSEVALFSLTTEQFENEDLKFTHREGIRKLLDKPKKLLATILIANNAINIAIVLLFASLGETWFEGVHPSWLKFMIEVVIVTFLILMFGEILPKIYANRNNMQFANFMAPALFFLDKLLSPLSLPMRRITLYIHEKLGHQKSNFTIDQLSQALELTDKKETSSDEQKLLEGIVSFGNIETRQLMKPRLDVFALEENQSFSEVVEQVLEHGYSRVPVYTESLDQIVGILYIKDLLPYIDRKNYDWNNLVRTAMFIPENKKLDDLLKDFQQKRNHIAIVVDEYGGTSGIVTLEDVIEEIVGDISDEFDDEDVIYSKLDAKNYVFEGKTTLKDVYKILKLEDENPLEKNKGEAETLAGLILEISGSFPVPGQIISLEDYRFTIEALDKKRIKQLKITLP